MTYIQFIEQDNYCKKFNVPGGPGCDSCPATLQNRGVSCADSLRRICGELMEVVGTSRFNEVASEIKDQYGLNSYNILSLMNGVIEFPEALPGKEE